MKPTTQQMRKLQRTLGTVVAYAPGTNVIRALGGPGSGNFGHEGRPGEVGGSGGGGSDAQIAAFNDLTVPMRKRALIGEKVVYLEGGRVKVGFLRFAKGDQIELNDGDGGISTVSRNRLRQLPNQKRPRDT